MAKKDGWIWCMDCEKTYQYDDNYVPGISVRGCPWCGSSYLLDGWDWQDIRDINPEYPVVPVSGVHYPMYK